jgi:hypothetical protein
LEGHLEKDGDEQEGNEAFSKEESRFRDLIKNDNQLRSAVHVLQSWGIFSFMESRKPGT